MTLGVAALSFAITAVIVVVAGTYLARSGDVIAARTGLGGVWVGSVFLALATSLPEIVTDVAAVRLGAFDLAAGDLFGSSMANMLILAIISLVPAGAELFRRATLDHVLYASLAVVMTAVAAITVLQRPTQVVLGVGGGSFALLLIYAFGSRVAFMHSTVAREATTVVEMSGRPATTQESERPVEPTDATHSEAKQAPEPSLRRSIATFLLASVVILLAAPRFARSAEAIAELTGIGSTFIGTWLVGLATSLPELATSLSAVRLRAYDLAVGNLFGSNALNMTIFFLLDLVYGGGAILGVVSTEHALSALVAIVLMSLAVSALVLRGKGRLSLVEPGSVLIIVGYVLGLALIFLRSSAT